MQGHVFQINVKPQTAGQRGIPKRSVESAEVDEQGLEGDFNRWRTESKQGSPAQAVLVLTRDVLQRLNDQGWPVRSGDLGDNLTLDGCDYSQLHLGQRLTVGEVQLELTEEAQPCRNLAVLSYVGPEGLVPFMKALQNQRGWYAKVLKSGIVRVGDDVQ